MSSNAAKHYFETKIVLAEDPLSAAAHLAASGLHADYVVYENADSWSYAGGILAEITLDWAGARLRQADEVFLSWDGQPLRQVRHLLESIDVAGWRAYGWAAFELSYAKTGDRSNIGKQRLLHLVVPHTEIRLEEGVASLRSADPETLTAAINVLSKEVAQIQHRLVPLDVQSVGADEYQRAVTLAVQEINKQKIQKVILSRVVPVGEKIDLVETYIAGRRGNSPARSFLLSLGGLEAAGFCPEIIVDVDAQGRVTSQPLAGTRALTEDPAENLRLGTELVTDSKEIYEHAISVKISWDELMAVCEPDSVDVEEFMIIAKRGSVQHLASRVSGQLADGRSPWDAFGAVFPAVTASGVPKDAAYTCIRTHESQARGLYSGAVLAVDQDGAIDAGLVLRAIYRQDGQTWLRAGAGIVAQSHPEREFEETCEKLGSVARFLVAAD